MYFVKYQGLVFNLDSATLTDQGNMIVGDKSFYIHRAHYDLFIELFIKINNYRAMNGVKITDAELDQMKIDINYLIFEKLKIGILK